MKKLLLFVSMLLCATMATIAVAQTCDIGFATNVIQADPKATPDRPNYTTTADGSPAFKSNDVTMTWYDVPMYRPAPNDAAKHGVPADKTGVEFMRSKWDQVLKVTQLVQDKGGPIQVTSRETGDCAGPREPLVVGGVTQQGASLLSDASLQ